MAVAFVNNSTATTAGGSLTISVPAGVSNGNLLLLLIAGSASLTCSTPSGWTAIAPTYTTGPKVFSFYRIASSEPASYVIGTSSSTCVGTMVCYSGNDTSTPVNAQSAALANGASSSTVSANGVTTTQNGCEVLFLAGTNGAPTFTGPSGFAQRVDAAVSTSFTVFVADELQSSAGATGGVSATASSNVNSNGFLVALTPSAAAVPTITTAPTISGGATDGSVLTSTTGSWTNSPTSYTYQWARDGVNISGATGSTYTLALPDRTHAVTCFVTAHNGSGDSAAVVSSNSITGTAPSPPSLGRLRWAVPAQASSPTTVDLTGSPGNYFATWVAGADYIVNLSTTVPRTGIIEVDANGARSVKIIGGLWALNDGLNGVLNYHIHIHNLLGWAFIEGQEADMSQTHADFLSVSGGTTYTPDIYFQNCRILNLTADNTTNHADIFQPQGLVRNIYADKLTYSSNYDGFTVAADGSTGSLPLRMMQLSRINSWFSADNGVNPFTAHYWLNNANGVAGNDTAPFPVSFDDVWCDLSRGFGRSSYGGQISRVIYPGVFESGSGQAGGGNLSTGGASPFSSGEVIGAQDATDHSYAYISNTKMKVGGVLWSGSPDTSRSDVVTDADSLGSFVPAGIGSNYASPGYDPDVGRSTIPI